MLLTLLTYCYSTGLYSSEDIENAARNHKTINYLCGNRIPDWKTLRRFRRIHRQALHDCISYMV